MKINKMCICLSMAAILFSELAAHSIEGIDIKGFGFNVFMYDNDPIIVGNIPNSPADKNLKSGDKINKVNKKNLNHCSLMDKNKKIIENTDKDEIVLNVTRNGKKEDIILKKEDIFVSDYLQLDDFIYLNKKVKTDGKYAYVWDKALKNKDLPISNEPKAKYLKTESKIDCAEKKILDIKQLYYGENDKYIKEEINSEYSPMNSVAPNTIGEVKVYYACLKYETQKYDVEHPPWLEQKKLYDGLNHIIQYLI